MTLRQWLTTSPPLENERDAMARVGFRFLWCTAPYFLLSLLSMAFGYDQLLQSQWAIIMVGIPLIGGLADWRQLKQPAKAISKSS